MTNATWCYVCDKMVELAVDESAAELKLLVLGGGGAAGGVAIAHFMRAHPLLGAAAGLVIGLIAHAALPHVQRLVCGHLCDGSSPAYT